MADRKVVIIGSGPAGLTAALYSARANLNPLLIEGLEAGGQLMLTTMVENYPGYRDGIMGPDLMSEMREQAKRFGAEFVLGNAEKVDVCGGYSAMEEAIFLTRFATKVTVVHRRDTLRASKIMQDKARANPRIVWMLDSEVEEIHDTGKGEVTAMVVRHNKTQLRTEVPVAGVFVAIGHTPNTSLFRGQLELDQNGYVRTHDGAKTSVAGVFACGDVQDHIYRQAITAAGTGCMAAIDAEHFLDNIPEHLASV